MKSTILIFTFVFIITTSCGFKVVKQNDFLDFDIAEIETRGDNEINYKIKNKLLSNTKKNDKKLITITLDTKKTKKVKVKNIKNQITKYQITISIVTKYTNVSNNVTKQFTSSKTGDFSVEDQYSQTRSNEKNLINLLSNNLATEISEQIKLKLNDI